MVVSYGSIIIMNTELFLDLYTGYSRNLPTVQFLRKNYDYVQDSVVSFNH